MLKIKDNVDLKELERFGFEEKTYFYYKGEIRVNKQTRIIEIGNFKYSPYANLGKTKYMIPGVLLDVVEAGLVNKLGF